MRLVTWNPKDGFGDVPSGFRVTSKLRANPTDQAAGKKSVFVAETDNAEAAENMFSRLSPAGKIKLVNNYLTTLASAKFFGGEKAEIDSMVASVLAGKSADEVRAILSGLIGK